jgi:hypothetical protein
MNYFFHLIQPTVPVPLLVPFICDGKITVTECSDAVNEMKLNKSPGLDGLSIEFLTCLFFSSLKKYELFFSPNSTHCSLALTCAPFAFS